VYAQAFVRHHPLCDDAVVCVESEGALEEAGGGLRPRVVVDLRVGQARVVVDDRVHMVDAVRDAVLRAPIASHSMTGSLEAHVLADVHVQEVARAGPLVAVGWLSLGSWRPREPRSAEHLPHGRVSKAGRSGNQPGSPAGLSPAGADPLLEHGGELPRRAMWSAGAIEEASERTSRLLVRLTPAMPPAMSSSG